MGFTQDLLTSRRNIADGSTRIGELDRLWYSSDDNTIRIGDGATPGGIIVCGGSGGNIDVFPSQINHAGEFLQTNGTNVLWAAVPAGPKGDQGEQGIQGPKGDTGLQGIKGDTGDVGPKGDTGDVGPKGDTGDVGPKGDTGDTGPRGPGVTVSATAPSSPTSGDLWWNTTNGNLYIYYPTSWVLASNLVRTTTLVTTASYTAQPTDWYIGVNRAGPVAITLPTGINGQEMSIKDESGNCASNPITIIGTIDNDTGGATLSTNNGGIHLLYRSGWRII